MKSTAILDAKGYLRHPKEAFWQIRLRTYRNAKQATLGDIKMDQAPTLRHLSHPVITIFLLKSLPLHHLQYQEADNTTKKPR